MRAGKPVQFACILAVVAAACYFARYHGVSRIHAPTSSRQAHTQESFVPLLSPRRALVYPYSVIPGGVDSGSDVQEASDRDILVGRHYAGIDIAALRKITVTTPFQAYVSYRKGNRILWTSRQVLISQGESILADGSNMVRGRCGNRISLTPQRPIAAAEPGEMYDGEVVGADSGPPPRRDIAFSDDLTRALDDLIVGPTSPINLEPGQPTDPAQPPEPSQAQAGSSSVPDQFVPALHAAASPAPGPAGSPLPLPYVPPAPPIGASPAPPPLTQTGVSVFTPLWPVPTNPPGIPSPSVSPPAVGSPPQAPCMSVDSPVFEWGRAGWFGLFDNCESPPGLPPPVPPLLPPGPPIPPGIPGSNPPPPVAPGPPGTGSNTPPGPASTPEPSTALTAAVAGILLASICLKKRR